MCRKNLLEKNSNINDSKTNVIHIYSQITDKNFLKQEQNQQDSYKKQTSELLG